MERKFITKAENLATICYSNEKDWVEISKDTIWWYFLNDKKVWLPSKEEAEKHYSLKMKSKGFIVNPAIWTVTEEGAIWNDKIYIQEVDKIIYNTNAIETAEELKDINQWFADNDWIINKVVLREWTENDARLITYLTDRKQKRLRQDELNAKLSKMGLKK